MSTATETTMTGRTRERPMDDTDQRETIAFLAGAAAHDGVASDAEVEHVETHISHVFLAGERVLKLKKAVRLDFLDFSSLARREAACRAEIAVNRIAAPTIYQGVLAVVRGGDGRLALADAPDDRQVLDWVVAMRRFPQEAELDRMALDGRLARRHILALADRLAELHAGAERRPEHGGAAIGAVVDEIDRVLGADASEPALRDQVRRWASTARTERDRLAPMLEARRRRGCVRRCHGDMHLANICWLDGAPTPFDAIEFSEELASTDVLYDLAFPVMDLIDLGLPDLAATLTSRYLGATRDHRGVAALPLFASIRAAVRALTAALRGDVDRAARRMDLAERLLVRPTPRLVAIGGASGTGKSTLAAELAPALAPLGAVTLRSDEIRKRLRGVPPEISLPASAYDAQTSAAVYGRMLQDARRTLLAGSPAILDAAFLDPARRAAAAELATRLGVRFDGVWLELGLEDRRERLARRRGDASDATPELAERQTRLAPGPQGWIRLDAAEPRDVVLLRAERALSLSPSPRAATRED